MKRSGGIFSGLFARNSKKGKAGGDKSAGQAKGPWDVHRAALPLYKKGSSLAKSRKFDEALSYYDRAIEIDRTFAGVWIAKGSSLLALGRNEEALACFEEALDIDPSHAHTILFRNICLVSLGRLDRLP